MKFGKDEALSWLISLYPRIYTIANSRLLAIIMAWQHFDNRKSVSQNKMWK